MNKRIYRFEEIKDKIYHAADTIADPVAQTLSPKGGNVVYEDDSGNQYYTKDGYTIINNIQVKDEVENAIIEIIKGGSRKTNLEAGDGTSSTIVMSRLLIKEGLRLVEDGHNQIDVRDVLNKWAVDMKAELTKMAIKVKDDKDLKFIANISASNDDKTANDVVQIIKVVGEDGQVLIDRGYNTDSEIIEDTGFVLRSGIFAQELANKQFQSGMLDVPIIVTDKRLYYKSEAETILSTVLDAGYEEVVIVAQDFIGEALPYFIANHINSKVRIILVAEKKPEILEDLAIYLGCEVISDKKGSLVDNITIDDFAMSKKVFSDPAKSIISRDKDEVNKNLDKRIKAIKKEMKKIGNKNSSEYEDLEKRLSSLTTGMVTVKVGGATGLEVVERIHRYEDAINATRAALREGYLPGAGVAVYNASKKIKVPEAFKRLVKAAAEVNIRQIAENCGKNPDSIVDMQEQEKNGYGFNAVTGKFENMINSGIIEPLTVATQVIANAVSIANVIITSRYFIVNSLEDNKDK